MTTDETVRLIREVLAYDNPFAKVFDDEVAFPDGSAGKYLRIASASEGPGVVVLPLHDDSVGMVRTYRYPVASWQWALPRGFAHATDPLITASAELREELGVEATSFRTLGTFTPDSGILAQQVAVVVAHVEDPHGTPLDTQEVAETRWTTTKDLWIAVTNGQINDGMTLAAMTLARAHGLL